MWGSQDMTPGNLKEDDPKCDRDITVFGYLCVCLS